MATKVRGGPPTKEKRGTSPSQPAQQRGPTTQRGKSPITPKPTTSPSPSAAAAKRSTSTSPSARNVPNYLKPTRSTGPESSSNPLKKNDTALKPVMSRRKSLDKPLPPSSPVPKTRVSAIAKDTRSQIPSSPSSARANTSSSKANVGGRIGKARSFNAEKESRVLNHVKKVENEASGNKMLPTKETVNEVSDNIAHIDCNNAIDDTPQIEAIAEKVEEFDCVSEDRNELINDGDDNESEVIIEEDNKSVEPEPVIEVEEVKIDESSVTPKDETPNNNEEQEPHTTCTEEFSIPVEDSDNASEDKEVEIEEEGKTEVEVEAKAEVAETTEETKESSETVKEEEEEKMKEDEEVKKVEENNKKNENGGGGVKKVIQVVQGKKEMSVVSNDVIEETATKLREQRVNRVKALAGAFETVISNQ